MIDNLIKPTEKGLEIRMQYRILISIPYFRIGIDIES